MLDTGFILTPPLPMFLNVIEVEHFILVPLKVLTFMATHS